MHLVKLHRNSVLIFRICQIFSKKTMKKNSSRDNYLMKWYKKDFWIEGFGVCGPLIMNAYHDWMKLIQWIEWYHLMGAERIILYVYEASHLIASLLKFYVSNAILQLIVWPSQEFCIGNDNSYYCQWTRMHDCLYRMMYRYQYCIFWRLVDLWNFFQKCSFWKLW